MLIASSSILWGWGILRQIPPSRRSVNNTFAVDAATAFFERVSSICKDGGGIFGCRLRRLEIERSQEWDGMRSTCREGGASEERHVTHKPISISLLSLLHSSSTHTFPPHFFPFALFFPRFLSLSVFLALSFLVVGLTPHPATPLSLFGSPCVNHSTFFRSFHLKISLVFVVFHFWI